MVETRLRPSFIVFSNRLLSALAFAVLVANWCFDGLRFSTALANDVLALTVTCLLLYWCAKSLRRLWSGRENLSRLRREGLGLLALAVLLLGFTVLVQGTGVALCLMAHDPNYGYKLLRTQPTPKGMLRVYRTNFSALDDFGVVVRLEKSVLPGLIRSRTLFVSSQTDDVVIEAEDGGRRLNITPRGKSSDYGATVSL